MRSSSFALCTSVAITLAPSATKASAMARRIPCPAAVTSATLPSSRRAMLSLRAIGISGGLLRQAAHLTLNEAPIQAIAAHQVVRGALLNHLPGLQHHYPIKIADRRQAMGDRDHGPALHQPAER